AHSLRLGLDYRRLAPRRRDTAGSLSVIAESIADLEDSRNLWSVVASPAVGSIVVHEWSLWLPDTWRVPRNLTLNAGLRWEFSPAPTPLNPVYFYDPSSNTNNLDRRQLWPDRWDNLAPRFGIAWRPRGSERTVLRMGGGVYYNSSLAIATDTINGGPQNLSQHSSSMHAPFPTLLSYGFMPGLELPRIVQWSVFADHA